MGNGVGGDISQASARHDRSDLQRIQVYYSVAEKVRQHRARFASKYKKSTVYSTSANTRRV